MSFKSWFFPIFPFQLTPTQDGRSLYLGPHGVWWWYVWRTVCGRSRSPKYNEKFWHGGRRRGCVAQFEPAGSHRRDSCVADVLGPLGPLRAARAARISFRGHSVVQIDANCGSLHVRSPLWNGWLPVLEDFVQTWWRKPRWGNCVAVRWEKNEV